MGTCKWDKGTLTTMLDNSGSAPNTMASLAASGGGALGTVSYDNSLAANRYPWCDVEILWAYAVAPTAGQSIDIYFVYAVDGTNYALWTGSNTPASVVAPPEALKQSYRVYANTSATRLVLENIPLQPYPVKLAMVNNGGQALATSGTAQSLKLQPKRFRT